MQSNAMTPGIKRKLSKLFESSSFQEGTLQSAFEKFSAIVPDYQPSTFQAVAVEPSGRRWFEEPEHAVADALYRVSHRPHDALEKMDTYSWHVECNEDGLWSIKV